MNAKRHVSLWGLVVLGLAFGLGTASAEDKTFELKLSHWVPPSHPLQKAIQEWGDDIQKASNGTITYKIYPSQQLGKAFDHYDMARDGIADFVYVNPGYQPGRFPIISAGELPFLVGQAKGGNRAIAAWVTQLGGTNVQSSAPEARDILAKGVADAITFPWGSMLLFGIDKVTKYDMDEPLGSVTFQ